MQGEDTDKATVQQLRQAVEDGTPITTRLLNYKKNGEPFWNLLTMTPVKSSSGKVIKVVGVQVTPPKAAGRLPARPPPRPRHPPPPCPLPLHMHSPRDAPAVLAAACPSLPPPPLPTSKPGLLGPAPPSPLRSPPAMPGPD